MKSKRDMFTELTKGFDALKSQRQGKPAPHALPARAEYGGQT